MAYIGSPAAPAIATVSDDTITTAKLADDAVTSAKLDTNIEVDGNLTVDTNTLYVDSTNNRVGIGTTSPTSALDVTGTVTVDGLAVGDSNFANTTYTGSSVNLTGVYTGLTSDGGFAVNVRDSGYLQFATSNTERMRIDSSGNVGIGTTSPSTYSAKLAVVSTGADTRILVLDDVANGRGGYLSSNYSNAVILGTTSGVRSIVFAPDNTERMRIDTSGNVLFGTTSSNLNGSTGGSGFVPQSNNRNALFMATTSTSDLIQLLFRNPNGDVGSIRTNGSSTSYNTSSDYRLKEDVQPMSGSIDRVKALNPVNFAWKADGSRVDGFLAHEAQEVVPEAITGTKDAVDADGNPEYQGIDQSKLVPLLTAALQEAITEIESLKARVATLESA